MAAKRATFGDEFRRQVEESGVSRYRISKDTGISQAMLSRFMSGELGLSLEYLDRIADYLNLHVTRGK